MSIRTVLQIGDPILHAKAQKVEGASKQELEVLVKDLADTMHDMHLTGLAAPQVGESKAIFITEIYSNKNRPRAITDELRVYVNPRIIDLSDEEIVIFEGCGSVNSADFFGPVKRPKVVTIEAEDINGDTFRIKADGLLGRVILHEYDHLEGILFPEILDDYRKIMNFENYKKYARTSNLQKKNTEITVKELS